MKPLVINIKEVIKWKYTRTKGVYVAYCHQLNIVLECHSLQELLECIAYAHVTLMENLEGDANLFFKYKGIKLDKKIPKNKPYTIAIPHFEITETI